MICEALTFYFEAMNLKIRRLRKQKGLVQSFNSCISLQDFPKRIRIWRKA